MLISTLQWLLATASLLQLVQEIAQLIARIATVGAFATKSLAVLGYLLISQ